MLLFIHTHTTYGVHVASEHTVYHSFLHSYRPVTCPCPLLGMGPLTKELGQRTNKRRWPGLINLILSYVMWMLKNSLVTWEDG